MYDGVKKSNKEEYNYKKIKRSRRTKELTKRSSKTTENESSDEEQKNKVILTIEEELLKRKARVEVWRNKMRPKREDSYLPSKEYPSKAWTLDDENEEDDKIDGSINNLNKPPEKKNFIVIENNNNYHDMDEDDPLELYMQKVNDEAKSLLTIHQQHQVKNNKSNSKVQSTTLIRQSLLPEHLEKKPEVIEQNQDELEYLSDKGDNGVDSLFLGKQAKRKEIPAPNHELRNYQPFKKNFYVEVSELAKMIPEEVNRIRDEMDGIKVKGKKCPKPVKTWAQCGLSPVIHNVIKRMNFVRPTPIQAQAIPAIMSGRDIIGIAKTGSGKTLAFLLPMFRHIMDQPQLEVDDGPIGIVLTPTRELAIQTYRECRKFTKNLNLQVVCLYGGSCISEQIADLRKGAEIIICTPGRMIDMLAANNGRVTNCKRCTYLVLDEADRMFDLGFEPQVTKIVEQIRPDRQTVMFSATFPRQMELLARKILTKPMEIQVGGRSVVCSDIFQSIILIDYGDKFFKLLELLGLYQEQGSILVFVEKQNSADTLFRDLLKKGYPCLSLHGGMDQADRDSTICDFKNGVIRILVSTSIASRGLDVKNLVLVVNYDCPNHYEDYVHRVGRTGRAGNKGTAITFVTSDDEKYAGDLIKALELSNSSVPPELKDLWEDYCKRMKAEGIEIVKTGGGFSGKGYKFDADEAVQTFDKKIKQKWSLGMQNSDDEAEATEVALTKIEKDIDKAFVTKPKKITASQLETSLISSSTAIVLTNMNENKIATKINNCSGSIVAVEKPSAFSNILSQINNSKMNPYNTSSSTSQTSGGITTVSQNTFANKLKNEAQGEKGFTAAGMAKQIASRINMKLNYQAPEGQDALKNVLAVATGTDSFSSGTTEFYQSEIDINDFPQQVRWKLSSKETLASVAEVSEAMLTARGQYIPPGKEHEATDRRMHILIEGYREMHVQIARAEIRRILKEEMLKMESTHLKPCVGRYKIM